MGSSTRSSSGSSALRSSPAYAPCVPARCGNRATSFLASLGHDVAGVCHAEPHVPDGGAVGFACLLQLPQFDVGPIEQRDGSFKLAHPRSCSRCTGAGCVTDRCRAKASRGAASASMVLCAVCFLGASAGFSHLQVPAGELRRASSWASGTRSFCPTRSGAPRQP